MSAFLGRSNVISLTRPGRVILPEGVGVMQFNGGDLSWGTTGNPPQQLLLFAGSGGSFYAGRMVFTGLQASSFQIVSACGETLDTPHNCASGDFTFAFDAGDLCGIYFETLFADETEQTMSVDVYDADGNLVVSLAADATYLDSFVGQCVPNPSCLGVWSPRILDDGPIPTGNVCMTDVSGIGAPNLIGHFLGTGAGQWSVISGDPVGIPASTSKAIDANQHEIPGGPNHAYAALSAALASGAESGIGIFKIPSGTAPGGSAAVFGVSVGGEFTDSHHFVTSGSDGASHSFNAASSDASISSSFGTKWVAMTFRKEAGPKARIALTDLSVAAASRVLGDLGSGVDSSSHPWAPEANDTLAIHFGNGGARGPGFVVRHGPIALFSTDIGDVALEDIVKSIL